MGHRRHVGAVGLQYQPVERHLPEDLPQVLAFGEGDPAADAEVEPQPDQPLGVRRRPPEAVRDAADLAGALFGEDSAQVVVGIAAVHDERPIERPGEPDMGAKDVVLGGPAGVIVVVIEARLADGDDAGIGGYPVQRLEGIGGASPGVVGVDADGCAVGEPLGEGQCRFRGGEIVPDDHQLGDTGVASAFPYNKKVLSEAGFIEVGVSIDHRKRRAATGVAGYMTDRKP